jgi:hypothetical protein
LRWSFEMWRPAFDGDDHDHCTFCYYTAFSREEPREQDGWANVREGWTTVRLDGYRDWVCDECFSVLRDRFGWSVVPRA